MPLGALDIIIAADTAQLRKSMDTAVGIMQTSTQKMESFAKTAGASIAGYFALSHLQDSIKQSLDFADSLGKMSQKIGMSVDSLYSLQAAGKLADVDIQTLEKSLLKFNKGLGTAQMGSGDTANALKNLGISLKDSAGHLKTSDQYLFEVADKFKNMPDGIAKSTLAMQLFGKSGADMIPLLNSGSEALSEFSGIMDSDTAKSAEKFNDSLTTVGLAVDAVWMQMTSALSPTLSAIADDFVNVAKEGKGTGQTLGDDLAKGMKVVIALGYGIAAAFSTSGHLIGNFAAAASLLAEGDFKGAKFAWDKMISDNINDRKDWIERINKVMNATAESQKASDDQRARSRRDLEDFQANETKKEAAQKKALAEAQKIKKAYAAMESEQYKVSHNEYENSIRDIEDKGKSYLAQGVKQIDVDRFVEQSKADLKAKYTAKADEEALAAIKAFNDEQLKLEFEASEARKAALKTYNDGLITAQIDYYTAIGDESSAYYLQEEEKMKKLAETGWYTNEQMNAIKAKDNQRFRDEQWKKDNAFWVDLFENINKAMDDQFFNAMTGKFTKFGDWLKDLWSSITQSMSRGLSKSLADMMTGAFYKENKDGSLSGLIPSLSTNTFRMAGSGAALGYGSVLSADQVAQLGGTFGQATVTSGGTILDQGGKVIEAGSDLSTIANGASIASGINSLYTLASEGLISIGGSIAGSLANGAGSLYGMGLTAGGDFLTGTGSMFAGNGVMGTSMAAQLGGLTVAGLGGALGGYATGKLGDKLFGADTKAGSYGAIGGSIGAIAGSIVPGLGTLVGGAIGTAIGSLIGGAFGSTKTKDAGLNFGKTTGAGLGFDSIQSYADMQKKSWFSNKKWTDFADISENDRKKIKGIFDSYDYLLAQLGSVKHVALSAGKYTKDTFQDELAKSFITSYTGMKEKFKASFGGFLLLPEVENKAFTQIYNAWTEYAQSINKTTLEAITESVGQFVQSKRGFETWNLERSGNQIASLGKQAEWAQQDFDNLAKTIGVSGITVDNFLSKYEDAVKNSFDPNTIKQWDSLGSSLMNATNASDKYNQALADMASASNEASSTIANAASQLQAASSALNLSLKSQQMTASIAQMLAPDEKASALIGAESSRSQYDTLQKFYGTSLSDFEFLSTMQNSLSANQTEANVAMWNELSTAFAGAYQAEKQYQSIIESERIAQLQAEQQAAEALANQQRQAAEEAVRAAEERQRQLEEERKALEALKITSRDFLRGFNETILKDDPINLASYQLQYLTSDLNTFEQQLGISGVSLSNFATAYENAIAKNFTEENVNSWKSFGETLIKANDAQKAYNDSLKQTVNTGFMKDMMLSRVNQSGTALDIKEMVNQQADNNTNQSQQIAILYEVVKTLKDQLKIMKFGTTNQGVPA